MTEAAGKVVSRVLSWQLAISLSTALLLAPSAPYLLLLDASLAGPVVRTFLSGFGAAALVATLHAWLRLRKHHFVLRALALGSHAIEPPDLEQLGNEPGKLTRGWLAPHLLSVLVFASPWRPEIIDLTTGTSLALLGIVIVASAALPLEVLLRAACVRALELAPPDLMRDVVEAAERSRRTEARIPRRLVIAVATPVALVAVGSALIANAHLRRADEYGREATARALAWAALQPGPGFITGAGLDGALEKARALGFSASTSEDRRNDGVTRHPEGFLLLTTPLDSGSAEVHFSSSTVPVLDALPVLLALLLVGVAGGLGWSVGRAYSQDLAQATAAIRRLGTQQVLDGRSLMTQPPRFRAVLMLELGIARVAARFRTFARAQQRAIDARAATTRTRGLFFASVSHDLKSPLNAILGFAELVRMGPVTAGQAESLAVIDSRARELLAIIETILDAARVEAGQLSLLLTEMTIDELSSLAIGKARELTGNRELEVVGEIAGTIGRLRVDRVRAVRALATLIGYSLRRTQKSHVRVVAYPAAADRAGLTIELASRRYTARDLRRLLAPSQVPGEREHRGLALGLSLARSIFELHGGSLQPEDSAEGVLFRVLLPMQPVPDATGAPPPAHATSQRPSAPHPPDGAEPGRASHPSGATGLRQPEHGWSKPSR